MRGGKQHAFLEPMARNSQNHVREELQVRVLGPWLMTIAMVIGVTAQTEDLPRIVGAEFEYLVRAGDTLASIGARFGIEPAVLARINGLRSKVRLRTGQVLRVDGRHIVPDVLDEGLVINIPQRRLFLFSERRLVASYPLGLGRPDWPTPMGSFTVVAKEVDPVWDVPPSIQEEMRRAGKKVIVRIPPGPANPLGRYWIGISHQNLGVHGTNAPLSVYRFQSHGCIRLHPEDIADLFPRVTVGMGGTIVYDPLLLVRGLAGELYLEVHRDVYGRVSDTLTMLQHEVDRIAAREEIDWDLAREALRVQDGTVRAVSRSQPNP
ncbi:MAG TPA: L,D-transpeptidase family protein [Vicinamibacterales bacterium]|jgi:L,D-transpeptidase ErfK/SrfK